MEKTTFSENQCLSILQVVNELNNVKVMINSEDQKEQKLIRGNNIIIIFKKKK